MKKLKLFLVALFLCFSVQFTNATDDGYCPKPTIIDSITNPFGVFNILAISLVQLILPGTVCK